MNYAITVLQKALYEQKAKLERLEKTEMKTPPIETDTRITKRRVEELKEGIKLIYKVEA